MCRAFINGFPAKVEYIQEIRKQFNAHLCGKLFITSAEICAKASEVSDALKNTLTRTAQNLEKKGKQVIRVNDLPAFLRTKSVEKFKSINTKTINYQMEFEMAYDVINSIS